MNVVLDLTRVDEGPLEGRPIRRPVGAGRNAREHRHAEKRYESCVLHMGETPSSMDRDAAGNLSKRPDS